MTEPVIATLTKYAFALRLSEQDMTDQLDDAIDEWHAGLGADGQDLPSYLGATAEQYQHFLNDPRSFVNSLL